METALETALRLCALGFAVQWLAPSTKAPIATGWSEAPVMTPDGLRASYRPGFNVGFRAGSWSVVDNGEICVLDIDVRGGARFEQEALAAARVLMGPHFEPTVRTGSGFGLHQYLRFPIGASPPTAATLLRQADVWVTGDGALRPPMSRDARPAWQIELLSTGKNVVLPPSIHPDTLQPYVWLNHSLL
ncbi:MAG: bifunctional DNA primase/polymerase [Burkholderiales bacterium]